MCSEKVKDAAPVDAVPGTYTSYQSCPRLRHGASLLPPLLLCHRAQAQRLPAVLPLRCWHVGLPGTGRTVAFAELNELALRPRLVHQKILRFSVTSNV
jgi:hypothetical protein